MNTRRDFLKETVMLPLMGMTAPRDESSLVKPKPFVHLHVRSHFSHSRGACGIQELVERTKLLGMSAVALTDRGNLFGAIAFYRAAKRAGIKPVCGLELLVTPHLRHQNHSSSAVQQRGFPVTLLAKNRVGFKNLQQLATAQCTRGDQRNGPVAVGKETLMARAAGIICLSGGVESEVYGALLSKQFRKAKLIAGWHQKIFGNRYYIEVQRTGRTDQDRVADALYELAQRTGIPPVATSDVRYVAPEGFEAVTVLDALTTGRQMPELYERQQPAHESHLLSPEEMYQRFADHPDIVERSQLIAGGIDLDLGRTPRRVVAARSIGDRGETATEGGTTHVARARMLVRHPPRALLRTVCHVLGQECEEADKIADLIPEQYCGTLQEAVNTIEAVRAAYTQSSRVQRIFDLAILVEGKFNLLVPDSHKVLVGHKPLSGYVPLATRDGCVFAQWDTNDIPADARARIEVLSVPRTKQERPRSHSRRAQR